MEDYIYLSNRARWSEIMRCHSDIGFKEVISRSNEIAISGQYESLDGHLLILYRHSNELKLVIDDDVYRLNECVVELNRRESMNSFKITHYNQTLYNIDYLPKSNDPINQSDFDFNEDSEEDQDFYLFLYNVSRDPARQNRLYK